MKIEAAEWYKERVRGLENDPEFLLERVKLAFAEELCRLMEEQGLSHAQLAERLGTSRAYITRILRTDYNLTAETMVKLAQALDARVELSLVPKDSPVGQRPTHARVQVRPRRHEFVAADVSAGAGQNEFTTSDRPARARRKA